MTSEEAIEFLQSHQPMPSDADITEEQGRTYACILKHFEECPDDRCIPLLINSVSRDTWLGMYEHIKFVLLVHPRDQVVTSLMEGLKNGSDGVKFRCCWWAADIGAWDFEPLIRPLLGHADQDVREGAAQFLRLREELGQA
jgi:hypothetical protein